MRSALLTQKKRPVQIRPATERDLAFAKGEPLWQSDLGSEYLSALMIKKVMNLPNGELILL